MLHIQEGVLGVVIITLYGQIFLLSPACQAERSQGWQ